MLGDGGVQTINEIERRYRDRKMVEDGRRIWQRHLDDAKYSKMQEQRQTKDMMERYWPWGRHYEVKPRGLRNLRLEGLFPHQDFVQAKRQVGSLEMGRPGGGAPNVNEAGRRTCRTKEDPMLRFQWSKDLRKTVDNTLRYRTNKQEQQEYKRDLDKLVEEKIKQREKERMENLTNERRLGYTPGVPSQKPNQERRPNNNLKTYEDFKRTTLRPPNQITKNEKLLYPRKYLYDYNYTTKGPARRTQLSPLRDGKENGVELVPLMVEKRGVLKIPLGTTDVTRRGYSTKAPKWVLEGPAYLHELSSQMKDKRQHLEERRNDDREDAQKHFTTWDTFWGRPGHGAPRSALKKGCIQKMLYPKFIPAGVS